jgi:hypothetical protein
VAACRDGGVSAGWRRPGRMMSGDCERNVKPPKVTNFSQQGLQKVCFGRDDQHATEIN